MQIAVWDMNSMFNSIIWMPLRHRFYRVLKIDQKYDHNWDFLKDMPKLHYLGLFTDSPVESTKAIEIQCILRKRDNERAGDDFIEITFGSEGDLKQFARINDRSDAINSLFRSGDDHYFYSDDILQQRKF